MGCQMPEDGSRLCFSAAKLSDVRFSPLPSSPAPLLALVHIPVFINLDKQSGIVVKNERAKERVIRNDPRMLRPQ